MHQETDLRNIRPKLFSAKHQGNICIFQMSISQWRAALIFFLFWCESQWEVESAQSKTSVAWAERTLMIMTTLWWSYDDRVCRIISTSVVWGENLDLSIKLFLLKAAFAESGLKSSLFHFFFVLKQKSSLISLANCIKPSTRYFIVFFLQLQL